MKEDRLDNLRTRVRFVLGHLMRPDIALPMAREYDLLRRAYVDRYGFDYHEVQEEIK